jgi:hypothetical protein
MLSDRELVTAFIAESLQGRPVLYANTTLRAESIGHCNQLISKQHGVLVKITLDKKPLEFLVRQETAYSSWLHPIFQSHQFVSTDRSTNCQFYSYRQMSVLPGYGVNCDAAKNLWKSWRTIHKLYRTLDRSQALMVQHRNSWQPVKNIAMSNEMLFIETAFGETTTHLSDKILWLEKQPESAEVSAPTHASQSTPSHINPSLNQRTSQSRSSQYQLR